MRLYAAELSDFPVPDDGMGSVPSASFRHRIDLVQRLHPPGASQPLSPLLRQVGLGAGHAVAGSWPSCWWRCLRPPGSSSLAVDDTLCRKRGLTVYGTGMHHDPLISSRAKPLVSWGHDWVVLTLIVRCPLLGPHQGLEPADRLSAVSQSPGPDQGQEEGETAPRPRSGKEVREAPHDPNHRTRPELAVELISLVASWFPERHVAGQRRQRLRRGHR